MRIGLLSQWYEPEPVTLPAVLARELVRRGHSVRVLTGFPNYPAGRLYSGFRMSWRHDETVADVPVRRVALFPSHGSSAIGRVLNYGSFAILASALGARWFSDVEAIWVYNSPPTVGLPTWLVKARYRPRIVMHVMDLWPESLEASGLGESVFKWPMVKGGMERWLSMTYKVADAIACTSRNQVDLLAQRGVPRNKLSYVPIWVDETVFHPVPRDEALAAELGVAGKTVLLYAGAIGEPQGLDVLIEACSILMEKPRFHCIIAGSGIAEERLRAVAGRRKLTNVTFIGRWPIRDMTRLMSVGDVHLVSLRSDPLAQVAMPSKLPATMACGKPIIVAALGDAADVVRRAEAGWTCLPGDAGELAAAIRASLAAGETALVAMGRRGRQAYETEFAMNAVVGRLERLLSGRHIEAEDVA